MKLTGNNIIVSGDQCAYWDAPIKLAAIRSHFPDREIVHHIHDLDTVGVPTAEKKAEMKQFNQRYSIEEEGIGARWTSGAICIPCMEQIKTKGEKFRGLVGVDSNEILASIRDSNDLLEEIFAPHNLNGELKKGYSHASREIMRKWSNNLEIDEIKFDSSFNQFLELREESTDIICRWSQHHSEVYNECAQKAKMGNLSISSGELPFFFIFNEENKLVRRRAYLKDGIYKAYIRNNPRQVDMGSVVAIAPKALLLVVMLKNKYNIVLPKSGSAYMAHAKPLVKSLGLSQLETIYVDMQWHGFSRPFVNWIYEREGIEGIKRVADSATITVE